MRARVYLRTWHTLPGESAHRSKPRPEDTDFQDVPSRVPKPVRIPARESSQTDRFLSPLSGYRACRRDAKIRLADILHMSSGLRIKAPQDPDYNPSGPYPDHLYLYTGSVDSFHYAAT